MVDERSGVGPSKSPSGEGGQRNPDLKPCPSPKQKIGVLMLIAVALAVGHLEVLDSDYHN